MRPLLIILLILKFHFAFSDPTQLNPGDIAIIGYNFRDPDEFSFITFVSLSAGTVIYFTDCGWKSDDSFREGEGLITYTVPPSGKNAKEVITFNSDPGFTIQGIGGFFGFSVSGDQIFAFQGSFASPNFIFAINNNGSGWQATASDNNTSALPLGLTNGVNAVALNEIVNSKYNCSVESGTQETLLTLITNSSNWTGSNTDRVTLPSECFQNSLPVNLISFKAIRKENINTITFMTENEFDIISYEIQKSDDGINYFSIISMKVLNKKELNIYTFYDANEGSCYYRLKEIDFDGTSKYHHSVFVSAREPEILEYFVYDVSGILKFSGNGSGKTEKELLSEEINFGKGIYLVKMVRVDGVIVKKVIRE